MSNQSYECVFHGDRLRFDQLEKELRQTKWIPRGYSHRLASAICSCRKHVDLQPCKDKISESVNYFKNLLQSHEQTMSISLAAFIKSTLDCVGMVDYSRLRFLQILFMAKNGDFSLLTLGAICRNYVEAETDNLKKTKQKIDKFTEKQYDLMMRKKKRKMWTELIELPVFPGHFKKLNGKIGSSFADYSKQERFIFQLNYPLNHESFRNGVEKTFINIWSKEVDAIDVLKKYLCPKAEEVQAEALMEHEKKKAATRLRQAKAKERRERRQKEYPPQRLFELNWFDDDPDTILDTEIECSSGRLAKTFGQKTKQDKKATRRKSTKTTPVDDRHCFNCLKSFSKQSNTKFCKHHPGYIVSNEWSCCEETVQRQDDLELEHSKTGCVKESHNWRINKKNTRKSKT